MPCVPGFLSARTSLNVLLIVFQVQDALRNEVSRVPENHSVHSACMENYVTALQILSLQHFIH